MSNKRRERKRADKRKYGSFKGAERSFFFLQFFTFLSAEKCFQTLMLCKAVFSGMQCLPHVDSPVCCDTLLKYLQA